jgi:tRNA 5-methylaminomethyl-2-thiouridine biosynthesis bifunctional protein
MIGMLGDEQRTAQRAGGLTGAHALDLPRRDGLYAAFGYGSRGLIWSALAAELLLSQIEHTPPPIETDLVDAIDPARFLLRDVRRGKVR